MCRVQSAASLARAGARRGITMHPHHPHQCGSCTATFVLQGWQYGAQFANLGQPREGGRAARRNSDFVRRRHWLRRATDASPKSTFVRAHDPRLVSSSDAAAADAAQRSTFNTTAKTAGAAFYAMLQVCYPVLPPCNGRLCDPCIQICSAAHARQPFKMRLIKHHHCVSAGGGESEGRRPRNDPLGSHQLERGVQQPHASGSTPRSARSCRAPHVARRPHRRPAPPRAARLLNWALGAT